MEYRLEELLDIPLLQDLQEKLNAIFSFPSAIINNDGKVLTAVAWQDVCTKFHRTNQLCEKECIKSDQYILDHIYEANPAISYQCPQGLVDNATPIIIDGHHLGNFFTGQFFLEPPDLEFFKKQAVKYGFDQKTYLEAVNKVPIWTKEKVAQYLDFIKGFIEIIAGIGLKHIKDIEAKQIITEKENIHKIILQTAMDGFWMVDLQGNFLEVNDTYCKLSGYSLQEILSMNISDIEVIESAKDTATHVQKVMDIGEDWFESIHRRKDGSIFDVEVRVQYQPVQEGRLVVFLHDITSRKKAERDLLRSEHELKKAQQITHIGSWYLDVETNEVEWTEELYKMYGFDPKLPPPPYTEHQKLFTPESWELLSSSLAKTKDTCVPYELELETIRKDGSTGWMWVRGEAINDNDGKIIGLWGAAQDITERKHQEEILYRIHKQLQEITDNIPQYISLMDSEYRYRFVNKKYADSFGISQNKLIGMHSKDLLGDAYFEKAKPFFDKAISGQTLTYELTINLPKEGLRNIETTYHPFVSDSGKIEGLIVLAYDITDRKKNEEAVRISNERFQSIFNSLQDAFFQADISGNFTLVSPSAVRMYGYQSTKEMIGMPAVNLYANESDRELILAELSANGGIVSDFIGQGKRKDGTAFWISMNVQYLYHNGKVSGTEGLVRDISERMLAEEKIKESEIRYRELFENSLMAISTTNAEGLLIHTNMAYALMYGYESPEEMIKSEINVAQFYANPADRIEVLQIINKKGFMAPKEIELIRRNGTHFFVLVSAIVIKDAFGNTQYFQAFHIDISERKQAEKELIKAKEIAEQNEEKFKSYVQYSPIAIYSTNSKGECVYANNKWLKIAGLTIDESLGNGWVQALHPDDKSFVEENWYKSVQSNGNWNFEYRFINKQGKATWVEGSATPLYNKLNQIFGYLGSNIDITERKKAELLLNEKTEQLIIAKEKAEEREEKYRMLVENTDTGFVVLDKNGKVINANEPYKKLAGIEINEEIIGRAVIEWTAPDEQDNNAKAVSLCAKHGFINDFETIYQHSNGTRVNILVNATVYKTAKGADQIVSYCRNITERKKAEEALNQTSARLELSLKAAVAGTWDWSIASGEIVWSKQMFDLFGLDFRTTSASFETWRAVLHHDDLKVAEFRIEEALKNHISLQSDYRVVLPDGNIRWINSIGEGYYNTAGEAQRMIGICQDITERKQAEKALQASKDYLENIINAVGSPIFVKTDKYKYYLVNNAFCSLLGSPKEKILGTTGYERFPKFQSDIFMAKDQKVFSSGKENIEEEIVTDGQGKTRTIITNKTLYTDSSGNKFLVGVITDITQRRMVEFNLEISQQDLREFTSHLQNIREEEKVELAREIHDDLGQVLVALKIDLAMGKKKILNTIGNTNPEEIQLVFNNLLGMVESTLKTARRIMSGLRPEIIESQGFIEASKLFIHDFEERFQISCRFENTVSEYKINKKNSIALFRILQEALSNISKHANANLVKIQLSNKDDIFIMEIIDNGIGFDQNNKTRQDSYGLMGMKERVILLKGSLNVKSTAGKGTSIRVEIPNVG